MLKVSVLVVLCAFSVVVGAFCPASQAVVLFGGADHSEQLPAHDGDLSQLRSQTPIQAPDTVPPDVALNASTVGLTAGVQQTVTPTLARPAIEWFMIPGWMAGSWSKKGDMTLSVTDLLTGVVGMPNVWTDDVMTVSWGHQIDRAGNVWHANFIPSERDGYSDGETVRFVTVAQKCEMTASDQLVTRTKYVVTKANSRSGRIDDMYQQEALNDYAATTANSFQNTSSNKMFKMNGQAYRAGNLSSTFTRVGNFKPVEVERGLSLKQSLADYLRSRNMHNLVPEIAEAQ